MAPVLTTGIVMLPVLFIIAETHIKTAQNDLGYASGSRSVYGSSHNIVPSIITVPLRNGYAVK